MGLDMYLMRANREEADGWDNLNSVEQRKVSSPWMEVCYWRKANQIRQWFVDNCNYPAGGNCEEVEVTKKDNVVNFTASQKEILGSMSSYTPLYDEITIKINIPYVVIDNNADNVSGDTYTWYIKKDAGLKTINFSYK